MLGDHSIWLFVKYAVLAMIAGSLTVGAVMPTCSEVNPYDCGIRCKERDHVDPRALSTIQHFIWITMTYDLKQITIRIIGI